MIVIINTHRKESLQNLLDFVCFSMDSIGNACVVGDITFIGRGALELE